MFLIFRAALIFVIWKRGRKNRGLESTSYGLLRYFRISLAVLIKMFNASCSFPTLRTLQLFPNTKTDFLFLRLVRRHRSSRLAIDFL